MKGRVGALRPSSCGLPGARAPPTLPKSGVSLASIAGVARVDE
jgi:hypothetical protein